MEYICDAGENMQLWRVNHTEVREQDLNAHVVSPETMERLQATIAKEGRLESVPFGVLRETYVELISGHHRIRSAVTAGILDFLVLCDTRDLPRQTVVAKQLAHNSIGGYEDQDMLNRLVKEITSPDLLLEAHVKLNQDALDALKPPAFDEAKLAFPVHRRNFVRQSDITFVNKQLEALAKIARLVRIRGRDAQHTKRGEKPLILPSQ